MGDGGRGACVAVWEAMSVMVNDSRVTEMEELGNYALDSIYRGTEFAKLAA